MQPAVRCMHPARVGAKAQQGFGRISVEVAKPEAGGKRVERQLGCKLQRRSRCRVFIQHGGAANRACHRRVAGQQMVEQRQWDRPEHFFVTGIIGVQRVEEITRHPMSVPIVERAHEVYARDIHRAQKPVEAPAIFDVRGVVVIVWVSAGDNRDRSRLANAFHQPVYVGDVSLEN